MSNPVAAAKAAKAARYAVAHPSTRALQVAHAALQAAKAEGATPDELRAAADKIR